MRYDFLLAKADKKVSCHLMGNGKCAVLAYFNSEAIIIRCVRSYFHLRPDSKFLGIQILEEYR